MHKETLDDIMNNTTTVVFNHNKTGVRLIYDGGEHLYHVEQNGNIWSTEGVYIWTYQPNISEYNQILSKAEDLWNKSIYDISYGTIGYITSTNN